MWSLENAIGTAAEACYCNAGYRQDGETCVLCAENEWAEQNSTECTACLGNNIFSAPGSTSEAACTCDAGYYKGVGAAYGRTILENCTDHPWGNDTNPCARCPMGMTSKAGNNGDLSKCVCQVGFTKIMDPADSSNFVCVPDYQCPSFCDGGSGNAVCDDSGEGDPTCTCRMDLGYLDQPRGEMNNWCLKGFFYKGKEVLFNFPPAAFKSSTKPDIIGQIGTPEFKDSFILTTPDAAGLGAGVVYSTAVGSADASTRYSTGFDLDSLPAALDPPYDMAFIIGGKVAIAGNGSYEYCINSTDGGMMAMTGVRGTATEGVNIFADTPAGRLSNGDGRHAPVRKCTSVDTAIGEYDVKVYYWVHSMEPYLSVTYKGPDTDDNELNLESVSAGLCNAQGTHQCFQSPPLEDCSVVFKDGSGSASTANDTIAQLEWTFTVLTPMARNSYVDLLLSDFSQSASTISSFDFDTIEMWEDGSFKADNNARPQVQTVQYARIGCFKDGLDRANFSTDGRALGGGTCGTFKDATKIVASREQCYLYAVELGNPGFCMTRQSECFTAPNGDFESSIGTYSYFNQTGCGTTGNGARGYMDCYYLYNSSFTGTGNGLPIASSSSSSSHSSSSSSSSNSVFNCSERFPGKTNAWGPNCSNETFDYTAYTPTGDEFGAVVTEIGQAYCKGDFKCGRLLPEIEGIAFVSPISIPAGTKMRIVAKNTGIRTPRFGLGKDDPSISLFPSVTDSTVALGSIPDATLQISGLCSSASIPPPPPTVTPVTAKAGEPGQVETAKIPGSSSGLKTPPGLVVHDCEQGVSISMGESGSDKSKKPKHGRKAGGAILGTTIVCGTSMGGRWRAQGALTNDVSPSTAAAVLEAQRRRRRLEPNEIVLAETADGMSARRLLSIDGSGNMYYRGRRILETRTVTTVKLETMW